MGLFNVLLSAITLIIAFLFNLESPSGNPHMCMFGLLGISSTSYILFHSFDYF